MKNTGKIRGKFGPPNKAGRRNYWSKTSSTSTRLQELSLMNIPKFGATHYDIHLDTKMDYTISRIFQEMSLSELETLHHLCELERTQTIQSLALPIKKLP